MDALVASVEQSMGKDIQSLEWMSPETKTAAEAKLGKVTNKIGYPSKWKELPLGHPSSRTNFVGTCMPPAFLSIDANSRS